VAQFDTCRGRHVPRGSPWIAPENFAFRFGAAIFAHARPGGLRGVAGALFSHLRGAICDPSAPLHSFFFSISISDYFGANAIKDACTTRASVRDGSRARYCHASSDAAALSRAASASGRSSSPSGSTWGGAAANSEMRAVAGCRALLGQEGSDYSHSGRLGAAQHVAGVDVGFEIASLRDIPPILGPHT
jgi:hypothetical protein